MKFRCERDTLAQAVALAGRPAAGVKSATNAMFGVRITATDEHLSVAGTDLDLTIQTKVAASVLDTGSCVIPARLLSDVVRSLEPGSVTVEADDRQAVISAGRAHFDLHTYPVADFPQIPEPPAPQVMLNIESWAEGLRQVIFAASADESRQVYTGVLVEAIDETLRLVASDSYRLAMRDMGEMTLPGGVQQAIIPARTLKELMRVLPKAAVRSSVAGEDDDEAEDEIIEMPATSERQIGLSIGDLSATIHVGANAFTTRLIDGVFPNYRTLIPADGLQVLRCGKADLLGALHRVTLLAKDITTAARMRVHDGGVEVSINSIEVGSASEEIDGSYDGTEMTVAFNPRFLSAGIAAVTMSEVEIALTDTTRPAIVRSPGSSEGGYLYLIMPVRVS